MFFANKFIIYRTICLNELVRQSDKWIHSTCWNLRYAYAFTRHPQTHTYTRTYAHMDGHGVRTPIVRRSYCCTYSVRKHRSFSGFTWIYEYIFSIVLDTNWHFLCQSNRHLLCAYINWRHTNTKLTILPPVSLKSVQIYGSGKWQAAALYTCLCINEFFHLRSAV